MEVIIRRDAKSAAQLVAAIIANAIKEKPSFTLGLATGRTMESLYAMLADMKLDFSLCKTFNLDEYVGIPAADPNSYRSYMNKHLFSRINIDMRNTHLPDGMAPNLAAGCVRYEELMKECGGIDLQLLGIGCSGHIGFNEPLSSLSSRTREKALTPTTFAQNSPLFPKPSDMP